MFLSEKPILCWFQFYESFEKKNYGNSKKIHRRWLGRKRGIGWAQTILKSTVCKNTLYDTIADS